MGSCDARVRLRPCGPGRRGRIPCLAKSPERNLDKFGQISPSVPGIDEKNCHVSTNFRGVPLAPRLSRTHVQAPPRAALTGRRCAGRSVIFHATVAEPAASNAATAFMLRHAPRRQPQWKPHHSGQRNRLLIQRQPEQTLSVRPPWPRAPQLSPQTARGRSLRVRRTCVRRVRVGGWHGLEASGLS